MIRSFVLSLGLAAILEPLSAQLPSVDITMVPLADGRLEVRLRPDGNFTGIFSALVFTIRYPESSIATLGEFQTMGGNQFSGLFPELSGDVQYAGGYAYATYAGLGFATTNPSWSAGEMVFGHFPVINGPGAFSLINDGWTATHNADYYVSLGGTERPDGVIYETTTEVPEHRNSTEAFIFQAAPGSNTGSLTVESLGAGILNLQLIDANGRIVQQWRKAISPGSNRFTLEATDVATGTYRLRSTVDDKVHGTTWFIQGR
jgi:hypothetical protein